MSIHTLGSTWELLLGNYLRITTWDVLTLLLEYLTWGLALLLLQSANFISLSLLLMMNRHTVEQLCITNN